MIRPCCRDHLTEQDFEFVADVLARTPRDRVLVQSLLADPDTRDHILDQNDLFAAILCTEGLAPFSVNLFFYVLVRRAFLRFELTDPLLADYCASLLITFVTYHSEPEEREPTHYVYLIDHLRALSEASHREVFFLHHQLGNYSLFLTGMFPGYVRYQARHHFGPGFRYYEDLGAMGFHLAAAHEIAAAARLTDILEDLAVNFRRVRRALNQVAEGYLRLGDTLEELVVRVGAGELNG
ncbi:MAG: hypothetical protein ONB23_11530 [candidate division KSB1 bacterium]|nr:hypothetical protein [candidate division KSB1 bacterium]